MPTRTRPFQRAGAVALVAVLVALPACSGDDSPDSGNALAVPEGLETRLVEDGPPRAIVTFDPVPDADSYLLAFDEGQPIRLAPDDCPERCELTLDQLATAGATTVNVTALRGERRSDPTGDVELPAWPEPTPRPTAPRADQPVTLVVTRESAEGKPVVESEDVPAGEDVHARIEALNAEENVLGVGVDIPNAAQKATQPPAAPGQVPEGDGTWQREAMEFDILPESRGRGVQIAVIDDLVDTDHPSLNGADVTPVTIGNPDNAVLGDHGTGVTTMIAGTGTGRVPGIATGATIKAYDVWSEGAIGFNSRFAETIIRAVDDGADIISTSVTITCDWTDFARGGCAEDALRPAIDYAEREGVVVVAAAGNDGDGKPECYAGAEPNQDVWPAKFDSVIAVAGTQRDGGDYICNPDKDYIDVKAPGSRVLVAESPDRYKIGGGTSYAAPLMAGLVADLLAEAPDFTPGEIRDLIARSVDSNKRIIVSALFMSAGIDLGQQGPVIDPSTARQVVPFGVQFDFPKDSPPWIYASIAYDDAPRFDGTGGFFWDKFTYDTFPVQVGGLLFVDDEGHVTGSGSMIQQSGIEFPDQFGMVNGHVVECPAGAEPSIYAFTFDTPVYIEGQVSADESTSNRYADLTMSLGRSATAEAHGRLGHAIVLHNNFNDCPPQLENTIIVGVGPPPPWSEVRTWPERNVELFGDLYQAIVDATPISLEDGFFPPPEGDTSIYQSGGETVDGVQWNLQLGDVDFDQF